MNEMIESEVEERVDYIIKTMEERLPGYLLKSKYFRGFFIEPMAFEVLEKYARYDRKIYGKGKMLHWNGYSIRWAIIHRGNWMQADYNEI